MDYFLQMSKNPTTRALVKSLGLPLPMPPPLRREKQPWRTRILSDESVIVGAVDKPELLQPLAETLAPSGARVIWAGASEHLQVFEQAAEAWAEPAKQLPADEQAAPNGQTAEGKNAPTDGKRAEQALRVQALIYDASGIENASQLGQLYEFFAPRVRQLKTGGRVVILSRPATSGRPELDAARQALEGFTRSLAKELGRKGSTANLIRVEQDSERHLPGPLRFFLSGYSAFVTAQPVSLSHRIESGGEALEAYRSLRGKVALVTGGSRGIGAETAKALAREGAHVVVLDRPGAESEASRVARDIDGSMLLLDVSASDASASLNQHLHEQHGGVDIVVHNAGLTRDKTLGRMPKESWDMVLDVNLQAIIRLTEGLRSEKLLRPGGRLILLSSVGGIAGNVGQTNYAASKAGLIGYVRSLAPQLAPEGVSISAVAPGFIETQMTARMPLAIREAARRLSALNQGGQPRDVAEVITFLAMPWAAGMTGNVLRVCGGALIGA